MKRVIKRLEANADLVVIDTPAALMVSDPLPLMELATGVVLVARMNRSTRDKIRRLEKMVKAARGKLFGVVATGVSTGIGYYTPNGHGGLFRRGRKSPEYVDEPELTSKAPESAPAEASGDSPQPSVTAESAVVEESTSSAVATATDPTDDS